MSSSATIAAPATSHQMEESCMTLFLFVGSRVGWLCWAHHIPAQKDCSLQVGRRYFLTLRGYLRFLAGRARLHKGGSLNFAFPQSKTMKTTVPKIPRARGIRALAQAIEAEG